MNSRVNEAENTQVPGMGPAQSSVQVSGGQPEEGDGTHNVTIPVNRELWRKIGELFGDLRQRLPDGQVAMTVKAPNLIFLYTLGDIRLAFEYDPLGLDEDQVAPDIALAIARDWYAELKKQGVHATLIEN